MSKSKLRKSVDGKNKFSEFTHTEWYWFALAFRRKWHQVAIATIFSRCICQCCKTEHEKETKVKIHGDHDRAIDCSKGLFYVGRPGIKPEDILRVEVDGPNFKYTPIERTPEVGIHTGITMRRGTLKELSEAGFPHGDA